MALLYEYFFYALYLAQGAFTIWMLVDAYRRGAEYYWFWIVLLFQPIGAWVYFFAVKAGDLHWLRDLPLLQRRPPLAELRYKAEQVPTLANRLALAERLVEKKEFAEPIPHLEAVLAQEPGLSQALYLLAVCHKETGQPEKAVPLLEKIIARDGSWGNYAAWHLLIDVHAESGAGDKALAACREMARLAPTLQHHCLLAEHLLDQGHSDEAAKLLERSLEDHQYAPGFIRRRNWKWASQARRLQRQALSAR
jgi:hypothetical protein